MDYAPPRTTLPQYIPDDMGRDIESVAELDPFTMKHTSGIELEVEGKTLRFAFQMRDQPHAFAATQAQGTKTLPTHRNLVVASHKDFPKLSKYARYEDTLKSILIPEVFGSWSNCQMDKQRMTVFSSSKSS